MNVLLACRTGQAKCCAFAFVHESGPVATSRWPCGGAKMWFARPVPGWAMRLG